MIVLSCQLVILSTPGYNSMVETDHNNPLATRERERDDRATTRENISRDRENNYLQQSLILFKKLNAMVIINPRCMREGYDSLSVCLLLRTCSYLF